MYYKREEYLGYPFYSMAGHTFRKAIQQEGSWFRAMFDELDEHLTTTKKEFLSTFRPHAVVDGKVRPGWGTSSWGALQNCGLMQKTKFRRDGYVVMEPGPKYDEYAELVSFFEIVGELTWEEIENVVNKIRSRNADNPFVKFFTRDVSHWRWVERPPNHGWAKWE